MNSTLVFMKLGSIGESTEYRSMVNKDIQLMHFTNSFYQDWEEHVGVTSVVRGGTISVLIDDFPKKELIQWGMDPRKYGWGEIVVMDQSDETVLEKIVFECAACTDFRVHYMESGTNYFCTKMTLNARVLSIDGTRAVEQSWKNVEQ